MPVGIPLAVSPVVRLTKLSDEHTSIAIRPGDPSDPRTTVTVPPTGVELIAIERALIGFALDLHGGNRTHAAAFLALSRSALLYRMHKYHLAPRSGACEGRPPSEAPPSPQLLRGGCGRSLARVTPKRQPVRE